MHTSLHLSGVPESAAIARQCIARVAGRVGAPIGDVVAAVATELVANAVSHGREPIDLDLYWDDGSWRIEVHDGAPNADDVVPARLGRRSIETGRGLVVVEALANAWGAERASQGGKVVWAECRAEPGGASSSP